VRIHGVQHVPFEGLGHIGQWIADQGHSLTLTRLYAGESLPRPEAFDRLVIMGGPMNIYEDDHYPWSGFLDGLPERPTVFHWHGDTFDIPAGAVHLAESEGCRSQAFVYDNRILGLQFHLESTPATVREILEHCGHELVGGKYIQSADEISTAETALFAAINRLLETLLTRLGE
jgi:GMP synthase-like glutamine amidotransferase